MPLAPTGRGLAGVARRGTVAGWNFQLAVEVLQALHRTRGEGGTGLRRGQLTKLLGVDALQLQPALEALTALDWAGQVTDAAINMSDVPESRYEVPFLAKTAQGPGFICLYCYHF